MISIRIGRAVIRIHFSFLVFNSLIFLMRDSRLIMTFYGVCLLHEAGHLAAMKLTGARIAAVDISGAGIRIEQQKGGIVPVKSKLFVLLAGPAANLILFILLLNLGCYGEFAALSLISAVYNMLPYRSLDGGAIIALYSTGSAHERAVLNVLTAVKLLIIVLSAIAVCCYGRAAFPLPVAATALFICDSCGS